MQIKLCGIFPSVLGLLFIFVCHLCRPQTPLVLAWSKCLQAFWPMDKAIECLFSRANRSWAQSLFALLWSVSEVSSFSIYQL